MANQHTREDIYLDALTEMVEAINAYHTEDFLVRLYQLTLIGHLRLGKFALIVEENGTWVSKGGKGAVLEFSPEDLLGLMDKNYHKPSYLNGTSEFTMQFNFIIPTIKQGRPVEEALEDGKMIAMLLLGDLPETWAEKNSNLVKFLNALTHLMNLAIYNRRLEEAERAQQVLQRELSLAAQVQAGLYPKTLPANSQVQAAATQRAHITVSGDYYDIIEARPGVYIFCIADVSGKGFPAAMLMSNFQATLRTLSRQTVDLGYMVLNLNSILYQHTKGERFVTAFFGKIDVAARTFDYINAGHNAPYIWTPAGGLTALDSETTILGVFDPLPNFQARSQAMEEPFTLISYTDGLTETFNKEGEEYGTDRVESLIKASIYETNLDDLHVRIMAGLDEFRVQEDTFDDITLFSVRFRPV